MWRLVPTSTVRALYVKVTEGMFSFRVKPAAGGRTTFIKHPGASFFPEQAGNRVFQQPQAITLTTEISH
jgi:hypothetical protein